ncbi:MAG TPA: hypothetical protein VKF62_12575 [Planctomycetota bacterium]|nr:hypothetical protein [Planctomycetota bacterium]
MSHFHFLLGTLLAGSLGFSAIAPGRGIAQAPDAGPAPPRAERCEECHTGASRDVASGRHAGVENHCSGCHGGDPRAFDERRAHAGKFKAAPLAACAACHEAEAEAFAKGPHGDAFASKAIRGCVECHTHHAILRPDHGLLRSACAKCHESGAPRLLEAGRETADALERLDASLASAAAALEEVERGAGVARGGRERFEATRLSFVELLPRQHAMALEPFRAQATELRGAAEAVARNASDLLEERRGRRRGAGLVVALVLANAGAILWKRRTLPSPEPTP